MLLQNIDSGANFAWTACGLSLGMDWTGCREAYESQLGLLPNERAQAMFLFAQMWENILEHPLVFASALAQNFWDYLKNMPSFLFEGYSPGYHVSSRFALDRCSHASRMSFFGPPRKKFSDGAPLLGFPFHQRLPLGIHRAWRRWLAGAACHPRADRVFLRSRIHCSCGRCRRRERQPGVGRQAPQSSRR